MRARKTGGEFWASSRLQVTCKLFMHWMQLILSRNKFIPIHACARAKPAVNYEPAPVNGDLQTFPCISADMRKVKFFGPNTSVWLYIREKKGDV